jgi:hypothetical protein
MLCVAHENRLNRALLASHNVGVAGGLVVSWATPLSVMAGPGKVMCTRGWMRCQMSCRAAVMMRCVAESVEVDRLIWAWPQWSRVELA